MRYWILLLSILLLPFSVSAADYRSLQPEIYFPEQIGFLKRDESSGATVNALATTQSFIKITGTVTLINGAVAPTSPVSRMIIISNQSGAEITIAHESVTASAANRFVMTNAEDLDVPSGGAATFMYDHGQSRWVVAGGGGGGLNFTAVAPIDYDTITKDLTCDVASGSQPGCLSAADWTTFDDGAADATQALADAAAAQLDIDNHIADASGAHSASSISNTPSGNLTADDVQEALDELQSDINTRELALTFNAPLSRSVNSISCLTASGSQAGCLASADWTIFNNKQDGDSDLTALAGQAGTGIYVRTGAGTGATRTITGPAAGISVSNGDGVSGNPTFSLADDLAALEALSGTNNIYYRSGSNTWSSVAFGPRITFTGGTLDSVGDSVSKTVAQTGHGFAVGDLVYLNSTTWTKAIATSAAAAEAIAMVSAVADANNFTATYSGYVSGLSGLTAGTVMFLSPSTAGAMTATEPSTAGQISKPVGVALSSTTFRLYDSSRGAIISSGGGGGGVIPALQHSYTTAGSNTFTAPSSGQIYLCAGAGGGGGAGGNYNASCGGGGGGGSAGAWGCQWLTVTAGNTITVVTGAGGAGKTVSAFANGDDGAATEIKDGSTVLLGFTPGKGGSRVPGSAGGANGTGGAGGAANGTGGAGGAGGTGLVGSATQGQNGFYGFNYKGAPGGQNGTVSVCSCGGGGGSGWGIGGDGGCDSNANGDNGTFGGGGGGTISDTVSSSVTGGNGGAGFAYIYY